MSLLNLPVLLPTVLSLMLLAMTQSDGNSQEPDEGAIGYWNWNTKTMGGRQFWTDMAHLDGWRIQHNHVTGHHRLLDAENIRHAWGNLEHCQQELRAAANRNRLQPYSGKVVILLHGLVRSHASMKTMEKHLQDNGYQTLNFQYASSRGTIGDHAKALERIIGQLDENVTEINFVAHSLGNLVTRHYLHNTLDQVTGNQGDSRIARMVMLGPPNQGSRMARLVKSSMIFSIVAGSSGTQLSTTWEQVEPLLATPQFEFGILAGGQANNDLSNILLEGKDDFTVSVEETKLPGAHDFVVRQLNHTTMMQRPESLKLTLSFLQNGYFVDEASRTPLESDSK
jgi:pimeloyl-ACP methyl ester carboxylesterase